MTPADLALDNAIHFEGVKHAYRQTKDGVVISFVVHPHDVPKGLADAPLGSRYIVALVQVGDDEQPVHQPAKEAVQPKFPKSSPRPTTHPPAAAKRDWRDIPPSQQAGIRCDDPIFAAFLKEQRADDWYESPDPVDCVYLICGITSRSELTTNQKSRVIWHSLDLQFQAWKALEHA